MNDGGRTVEVRTHFIRLDDLLKLSGVCESGGQAKVIIQSGRVKVNGRLCEERGKKLYDGDTVEIGSEVLRVAAPRNKPTDAEKEKKDK